MPFFITKGAIIDLLDHVSITPRSLYYIGPVYYTKGHNIISSNIVS